VFPSDYSTKPITRPTTTRNPVTPTSRIVMAPLVWVLDAAVDVLVLVLLVLVDADEEELPSAAAWNAANVLFAVGLTAKTIPL